MEREASANPLDVPSKITSIVLFAHVPPELLAAT